jgi:hypothetical protein
MGGLIVIVAVIIIVIFLRKAKTEGRSDNGTEALKNSNAYKLAIKIKDEFIKRGYNGREPDYSLISGEVYGLIFIQFLEDGSNYGRNCCNISFCENSHGLIMSNLRHNIISRQLEGQKLYGIDNANIGIMVSSEVPECITIASEVIKNSGYGSSTMIEYRD